MFRRIKLNRRLNCRVTRFATLRLSGKRPCRSRKLAFALAALNRAVRAHKALIQMAPELFHPILVQQEKQRREQHEKWWDAFEPVLRKVYGDAAVQANSWQPPSTAPAIPSRMRTKIDEKLAEWELWLKIGADGLKTFRQRHPHYDASLSQINRLLEIASVLGRLSCDMPFSPDKVSIPPEPPADSNFLSTIERIYGK